MEKPGGGAGLVAVAVLAGSHSGERDGAVTKRMERDGAVTKYMEETPEGLLVCRRPSHPTSILACCRDGHLPVRAGDPQIPGGCWWHLAEARLGHIPTCRASVSPAVKRRLGPPRSAGRQQKEELKSSWTGGAGCSYNLITQNGAWVFQGSLKVLLPLTPQECWQRG